jgi:hypothetical protein
MRTGGNASPKTLASAHETAIGLWPGRNASPLEWVTYHRRRAALFDGAAAANAGHRNEARYLAAAERTEADRLAALISPDPEDVPA